MPEELVWWRIPVFFIPGRLSTGRCNRLTMFEQSMMNFHFIQIWLVPVEDIADNQSREGHLAFIQSRFQFETTRQSAGL